MWCTTTEVSLSEATLISFIWTAIYVLVLYIPVNAGPRDARRTIISRLITLSIVAICFELHLHIRFINEAPSLNGPFLYDGQIGHTFRAFFVGTFLTLLLYLGHIVVTPVHMLVAAVHRGGFGGWYVHARNYMLAPLIEEIVFRRQFMHLYPCDSMTGLLCAAMLFALAHVHHVRTMGIIVILFHVAYTFLFGLYAVLLFVRTQSVWTPFAAHVVCNVLELPDIAAIVNHPLRRLVITAYIAAIIMFAASFSPITAWVAPYDTAAA